VNLKQKSNRLLNLPECREFVLPDAGEAKKILTPYCAEHPRDLGT
jgi:hypothetical protein